MLSLGLPGGEGLSRVLCLGAHSDDIEIGCGATILRLLEADPELEVHWAVLSADGVRAEEATAAAEAFLAGARRRTVVVERFRESYFPYLGADVKGWFDDLGAAVAPDLVFTHHRHDLHQDHRLVAELTWNTFRDHLILEYEIPKYDGDLGRPNAYVPLDRALCEQKVEYLLKFFRSQADKPWFSAETFWAVLRLRGIEVRSGSGLAEAFHGPKLALA